MRSAQPGVTAPAPAAGLKLANGAPRWVFFAIFTISGFSGLIYESIWSHYLKLFLGHAAYAQSLVLMIFMGGMALGSWLAAKLADRWRTPILWYAGVEVVIGLIALVFHGLFVGVSDTFYFSILPSIGSAAVGNALKWTAAAALIVPQSVLLGMTFPLLTTWVLKRYPDQPGGSIAMLYFTNSIGAAIGVLASGFWLLGLFGLPGTIMTAGLLNIALALVVWILVKLDPNAATAPAPVVTADPTAGRDRLATLFFFAAGITGAASFIYEIGWIRMLSLVLGGTTHAFELMLSAFITGLAFGGLWIKRRIDRIDNPVRFSGWVQVVMGVMALLTIPLYIRTFDWMAAVLGALEQNDAGYTLFTAFSHGLALLVMVPTTFLAGMTLPLFTYVLMKGRQGERAIGRVYAANTVGAIVGVVFAVHIGMPLFGLKTLIAFGAALDIALGLVLLYRSLPAGNPRALAAGAVAGAAALVLIVTSFDFDPHRLTSGVYRYRTAELDRRAQMLFYEDGKTASISLTTADGRLTISTNGKPDASIQMDDQPAAADEITMVMAASVPLAYRPDARFAANIGLGSGLTTHTMLGADGLERVDTIEIEAAMVRGARGFGERVARAFEDPRSAIHVEDAKTFFSQQQRKYDIVVAEPSNPWVSGVASLFSDEFYRTVRNYIAPDGLLVQWLQLYEFNDDLALSVMKSLEANFADFAIYNTDDTNILIVARPDGELPRPAFEALLAGPLRGELARVGLRTPADFLVRQTGSRDVIASLIANSTAPPNSDYFPFLDLNAGRARFKGEIAGLFYDWSIVPLPLLEMTGSAPFTLADVTADATFQRTRAITAARVRHSDLRADTPATAGEGSPVLTLELLRPTCGASAPHAWSDALHTVVVSSLPFLDAAEAVDFLGAAVPETCRAAATPEQHRWLELYAAVAKRDAAGMAAAGAALLQDAQSLPPARLSYVTASAMLGQLAAGRPRDVLTLWDRHGASLGADIGRDLRLILSLAVARSQ